MVLKYHIDRKYKNFYRGKTKVFLPQFLNQLRCKSVIKFYIEKNRKKLNLKQLFQLISLKVFICTR